MRTKYTEDYEKIWRNWPGRWREGSKPKKVGKAEGFEVWKVMDTEDQRDASTVVVSGKVKNAGTQYLPDFHRWLRYRRWEDFL